MKSRTLFIVFLFLSVLIVLFYSCKDMGTVPTGQTGITASSTNVTVNKGATVQITLSGGTSPYSIIHQPDTLKAKVTLASSLLTISGIDSGLTRTVVGDHSTPVPDSVEIRISVQATVSLVSFSNQIQPIFNSQCTGCHGGNGGLSLNSGVSYSSLVNVQAQSSCTSLKRVLPNNAANSVLYKKISGFSCGSQMPQGGSLSGGDIALIQSWINQGALNN